MEVTCLSVPNPHSYLLCSGVQRVENRGFSTDFRGRLYVHSSGRQSIRGMPHFEGLPVPVIHEFNALMDTITTLDRETSFIGIPDGGVRIVLKDEERRDEQSHSEYCLLSDVYAAYAEDPHRPFFLVNAIVGSVEVVDVVTNSTSAWAQDGYYHWILQNPRLLAEPIRGVRTTRSGLWQHELPEE